MSKRKRWPKATLVFDSDKTAAFVILGSGSSDVFSRFDDVQQYLLSLLDEEKISARSFKRLRNVAKTGKLILGRRIHVKTTLSVIVLGGFISQGQSPFNLFDNGDDYFPFSMPKMFQPLPGFETFQLFIDSTPRPGENGEPLYRACVPGHGHIHIADHVTRPLYSQADGLRAITEMLAGNYITDTQAQDLQEQINRSGLPEQSGGGSPFADLFRE